MFFSSARKIILPIAVIVLATQFFLSATCVSTGLATQNSSTVNQSRLLSNENGFQFVIPIYNNPGLKAVTSDFYPYIKPGDVLLVVSGNFNTLNLPWINEAIATLREKYPNNPIFVGTGGLRNVSLIVENITQPLDGIVYIYEPNLPYGPEFTWDFEKTAANLKKAADIAHKQILPVAAKPTGRPILQAGLQKYNWDYGVLAGHVDVMFVQTQTYCKKGPDAFEKAIDKLKTQFEVSNSPTAWFPEISLDPEAPNGVPVSRALQCLQIAQSRGVKGILMWWSPKYKGAALEFLQQYKR